MGERAGNGPLAAGDRSRADAARCSAPARRASPPARGWLAGRSADLVAAPRSSQALACCRHGRAARPRTMLMVLLDELAGLVGQLELEREACAGADRRTRPPPPGRRLPIAAVGRRCVTALAADLPPLARVASGAGGRAGARCWRPSGCCARQAAWPRRLPPGARLALIASLALDARNRLVWCAGARPSSCWRSGRTASP